MFLDLARYTGEYLKEPEADKELAEMQANEHFYELSTFTNQLFEEYSQFIDDYEGNVVGDQIAAEFEDMWFNVDDAFELVTGIEQHGLIVEEETEAGVDENVLGANEALKEVAEDAGTVTADGEVPEMEDIQVEDDGVTGEDSSVEDTEAPVNTNDINDYAEDIMEEQEEQAARAQEEIDAEMMEKNEEAEAIADANQALEEAEADEADEAAAEQASESAEAINSSVNEPEDIDAQAEALQAVDIDAEAASAQASDDIDAQAEAAQEAAAADNSGIPQESVEEAAEDLSGEAEDAAAEASNFDEPEVDSAVEAEAEASGEAEATVADETAELDAAAQQDIEAGMDDTESYDSSAVNGAPDIDGEAEAAQGTVEDSNEDAAAATDDGKELEF